MKSPGFKFHSRSSMPTSPRDAIARDEGEEVDMWDYEYSRWRWRCRNACQQDDNLPIAFGRDDEKCH